MRVRGITLLETLVSLALVTLLFTLLIPLLRLSSASLDTASRAAVEADQIAFRNDLRGAIQTMIVDNSGLFSPSGGGNNLTLYSHTLIMALPDAEVQTVTVALVGQTATVTRTALASDQSVLFEESRDYALGLTLAFSYLPACQDALDWEGSVTTPPLAVRLLNLEEGFWPDFIARRPAAATDGC